MITALSNLIEQASSNNMEEREESILQIAMVFERYSPLKNEDKFYKSILSTEIFNITFHEDEREELVSELSKLIKSDKRSASMIWALGKALTISALENLIDILCYHDYELDEDAKWQALIGIDNFLSIEEDNSLYYKVVHLIQGYKLLDLLKTTSSNRPDFTKLMRSMIGKIETLGKPSN